MAKAIHLRYTTKMTQQEIADELGVARQTIISYLNDGPTSEEVDEVMQKAKQETRLMAVNELKRQLMEAGSRSRTAEKPVKVWQQNGQIQTRDVRDDSGQMVDMEPVPVDVEMLPDEEARYVSRKEIREILRQLTKLVGANEPEEHTVTVVDEWRDSANE